MAPKNPGKGSKANRKQNVQIVKLSGVEQTGRNVRFDPKSNTLGFMSKVSLDGREHVHMFSKVVIPKGLFTEPQLQVVIALCKTVNHFTLGHDVSKDTVVPSTTKDGVVIAEKRFPSRIKKVESIITNSVAKLAASGNDDESEK